MELLQLAQARPDNWPEAVATIIVTLLTWWLGCRSNKPAKNRTGPR